MLAAPTRITHPDLCLDDEDHVVRTVERHGRLHFWQIAMKPGRPLAFGHLGEALTIGLPGNPVAAAVCFMRLARPVLARLAGADWLEPRAFTLPAAFELTKKPGRTELLRARLVGSTVEIIRRQGSGILTSLTDADGLVEVAESDDDRQGRSREILQLQRTGGSLSDSRTNEKFRHHVTGRHRRQDLWELAGRPGGARRAEEPGYHTTGRSAAVTSKGTAPRSFATSPCS